MKKNSILVKALASAILFGGMVNFTSCKDDFSEEAFLKEQYELSEVKSAAEHARRLVEIAAQSQGNLDLAKLNQQISKETREEFLKAYEEAGLLVKANIVVLDAVTKNAIPNAKVSLFGKEVTTSAQGVANFEDIAIGGGDVVLEAADYYKAISPAIIAYSSPNVAQGGLPIQRTITATIHMVATGSIAESSVTVKGKVSLESDLTNAKVEFPKSAKVAVDYAAALKPATSPNGITFQSYRLDNPDFKPADVDAVTGEYSIKVPAITGVKLVLSELEEDVTYIKKNPLYNSVSNNMVAQYLKKTGKAVFNLDEQGAKSQYDFPATSELYAYEFDNLKGSGFDLDFKQNFSELYDSYSWSTNRSHEFNRGAGYKTIPTVKLAGNGSDKINGDKVYLNSTIIIKDLEFGTTNAPTTTGTHSIDIKYIDSSGEANKFYIGSVDYDTTTKKYTNLSITSDNTTWLSNVNNIEKFTINGLGDDQPAITPVFKSVRVRGVNIVKGTGEGVAGAGAYTSWPKVTFTGGSPEVAASFSFDEDKASQWKASIVSGGSYEAKPEIKITKLDGSVEDLRGIYYGTEYNLTVFFQINTGGVMTTQYDLTTKSYRPSEIATVVEDKLAENSGASLTLTFTNENDKLNDIDLQADSMGVQFLKDSRYTTKPAHKMVKKYDWVTDAVTPLVLDITYYQNTAPQTVKRQPETGKGYMNPQAQIEENSSSLNISASDKGKTITRNFFYNLGKLKE